MKRFFDWLCTKTIIVLSVVIALLGAISTRLVTCGTNTLLVTNQLVTNPANQAVALETASLVANLFYEGTDDPFPTPGAGGEIGKLFKPNVLLKGYPHFNSACQKIIAKTDFILKTSRIWDSPQIQKGARAIQKKMGHSVRDANPTAYANTKFTQENAEKLINNILNDIDAIVIRPMYTRIYNANGQGINILTKNAEFKGFIERNLESELKKQ